MGLQLFWDTAFILTGETISLSPGVWYIYVFFRKRRSHPDFRRKLREKRKAANRGGGDSSGPQLPDFSDQEAVQRFFLQEVLFVLIAPDSDICHGRRSSWARSSWPRVTSATAWSISPWPWRCVASPTLSSASSSKLSPLRYLGCQEAAQQMSDCLFEESAQQLKMSVQMSEVLRIPKGLFKD